MSAASVSMPAGSARSAAMSSAAGAAGSRVPATVRRRPASRPESSSRALRAASRRAISAPTPEEAPVTTVRFVSWYVRSVLLRVLRTAPRPRKVSAEVDTGRHDWVSSGWAAVRGVRGGAGSWRGAGRQGAELLEQAELVGDRPAFGDLAAGYPDNADPGEVDLAAGGGDAQERPGVGAGDGVPVGQLVAVGEDVPKGEPCVRERLPQQRQVAGEPGQGR